MDTAIPRRTFASDFSLPAMTAGMVAVAVSFGGPAAIIFQAARVAGLSPDQLSSWIWAICMGSGVTGVYLSMRYRMPVITAWSTPGVALLAAGWAGYPYADAVGAFIVSGALITLAGVSGVFQAMMDRIPKPVVSAMLAGILFKFGVDVFGHLKGSPVLAGAMLTAYVAAKRFSPRYAVVCTLAAGFATAAATGGLDFSSVTASLATPLPTVPAFDLGAIVGLGLPLFLVTMTGQNATGLGVMRASGYDAPATPMVTLTGAVSTLLAPFGCHGVNLAAITAAICTGPEAHPDPSRRWVAGVVCGACYLLIGVFGAALVSVFTALPPALIAVVSGVALFGAIASGLTQAMENAALREAALVTLLVTVSGVSFFGIGSAFWGLLGGVAVARLLGGDRS